MNKLKGYYYSKVPKSVSHNFLVDFISYIFLGLSNGLVIPFFYLVARRDLHADPFLLGLMTAATGAGMILGFLATGIIKQNKEVTAYIYINLIGRIGLLALAFSLNGSIFSLLMFIYLASVSMPQPQYGIVIQNIYPANIRATLISYTRIALYVTTLIATFIGGILIDKIGWRGVFLISGILVILSSISMFWFRVPKDEIERKKISLLEYFKYAIKLLKSDKLNRNIIIGAFIFVVGVQITTILNPMTQADIINLTKSQLGWLNCISSVVSFVSLFFLGPFIDKKGSIGALVLSFVLYLPIPFVYIFAKSWIGLIVAFVILGLYTASNSVSYFDMIIDLCPKGEEQIYQGVNSLWCGIRAFLDVVIGTYIINRVLALNFPLLSKHIILYILAISFCFIGILFVHLTCRKSYSVRRS